MDRPTKPKPLSMAQETEVRDPASKYDLTSTENLLNRNISNQGDKLNASIRELRTSIKEQNESIATLSSERLWDAARTQQATAAFPTTRRRKLS
jgi:hypothetical protein